MLNIDYLIEYDRSDPISIEVYSQKLIGKTFRQITDMGRGRCKTTDDGKRRWCDIWFIRSS